MTVVHRVTNNGCYLVLPGTPIDDKPWCGGPDTGSTMALLDVNKYPLLQPYILCPACIAVGGATVPIGGRPTVKVLTVGVGGGGGGGSGNWGGIFRNAGRPAGMVEPKPAAPAMAKKVDDGFNGSCTRCGKRTYTGATPAAFEHQGGPCTGQVNAKVMV